MESQCEHVLSYGYDCILWLFILIWPHTIIWYDHNKMDVCLGTQYDLMEWHTYADIRERSIRIKIRRGRLLFLPLVFSVSSARLRTSPLHHVHLYHHRYSSHWKTTNGAKYLHLQTIREISDFSYQISYITVHFAKNRGSRGNLTTEYELWLIHGCYKSQKFVSVENENAMTMTSHNANKLLWLQGVIIIGMQLDWVIIIRIWLEWVISVGMWLEGVVLFGMWV